MPLQKTRRHYGDVGGPQTVATIVLLLSFAASFAAPAQTASSKVKAPWQWTVDERIAARCDAAAARARVEWARQKRLAPTTEPAGRGRWIDLNDAIIGKYSPELVLPSEVFASLINIGFIYEGTREPMALSVETSGLPPTFWSELEMVAGPYIASVRERKQTVATEEARATWRSRESMLCAARVDALAKARALFGEPLDRFMYGHIAPTISLYVTHREVPGVLKARESGCR